MAWSRPLLLATAGLAVILSTSCGAPGGGAPQLVLEVPEAFERAGASDARLRAAMAERDRLRIDEPQALPDDGTWALRRELQAMADTDATWVAPRRLLDDLDREGITGPAAWARRAAAWQATGSGRDAYLLARLETPARAAELFGAATDRAPGLSWGWHGLAVTEANAGKPWPVSDVHARRALRRVESLGDLLAQARARVSILAAAGQHGLAEELARALAELPDLEPAERASLEALALTMAMQQGGMSIDFSAGGVTFNGTDDDGEAAGELRAAQALLAPGSGLTDRDAVALARGVLRAPYTGRTRTELLRMIVPPLRERLDERLGEPDPLGGFVPDLEAELDERFLGPGLLPGPRPSGVLGHGDRLLAEGFRRGEYARWYRTWRRSLPERVRALVPDLEAQEKDGELDVLSLAWRVMQAGWFDAAEALYAKARSEQRFDRLEWGGDPLDRVGVCGNPLMTLLREEITWRSGAGAVTARASLLDELERVFTDRFEEGDLDDLLADLQALVAETAATGHGVPHEGIVDSPLDTYGPFARLVTPLTPEDEPTAGLQAMLGRLGRVAIVGEQFGTLDGTVRPLLAVEPIEGVHLGAPYSGTILWCSGVDVRSRAERAGAQLAGAAVHDGYWIDLEVVRAAHEAWRERAIRLVPPDSRDARDELRPAPEVLDGHRGARRVPLLGEADRLALVLVSERSGEAPTLDQLLDTVTVHEEGHLCDRARFLPIGEKWGAGLRFFASCGFSPNVMMQRLEYRAQLVALAVVDDPRLVLWEVLEQAEATEARSGAGVTPHGSAYVDLLNDLVSLVDERGADAVGMDPGRYLRWQLHLLETEVLRELAVELAEREGLAGEAGPAGR